MGGRDSNLSFRNSSDMLLSQSLRRTGALSGSLRALAPLGLLMVLAACDSSGTKNKTTSSGFFAPVPIAVDSRTGTNANGERRVEVLVDKIRILSVINPGTLRSELEDLDAEVRVLGTVKEGVYILHENNSGSLLEYNIQTDDLSLAVDRIELANTFFTPNARLASVANVQQGAWIFGYETSQSSLFVMRRVLRVGGVEDIEVKVLANRRNIQTQIRKQQFNFVRSFEIGQRSFQNDEGEDVKVSEVLLIASPGGGFNRIDDIHMYVITEVDGEITGTFRVFDEMGTPYFGFTDGDPVDPKPIIPENHRIPPVDQNGDPIAFFGLVNYDDVRVVTGLFDVLISDFQPVVLRDPGAPGADVAEPRFFTFFDRSSGLFLLSEVIRETRADYPAYGEIVGNRIGYFTIPEELATAIRQGGAVLPGESVDLRFAGGFHHPSQPYILVFEEDSNNMLQLNYSGIDESFTLGADPVLGTRARIFSSAQNLLERRDTQSTNDADQAPQEPSLSFSVADVSENRLMFDAGTDDILSINYNTGRYVVVIKQSDIGAATGSPGVSNLTFIQPVTARQTLVMDTQASDLLLVRLDYAFFPLRIATR
jgi:hypothetical protein